MTNSKRVLVDLSATIIHHGHIRILKAASQFGSVVVALTTDEEILKKKSYTPELSYAERAEIISAIRYVDEVIPSPWLIDEDFMERNQIDILVHGDDNSNLVSESRLLILPRTPGVSSTLFRERASKNLMLIKANSE